MTVSDKPQPDDANPFAGGHLTLSPAKVLHLVGASGDVAPSPLSAAFRQGHGHGLTLLAAGWPTALLNAPEAYWRDFAKLHLTRFVAQGKASLDPSEAARWLSIAPPLPGGEYLDLATVDLLWHSIAAAIQSWQNQHQKPLQELLAAHHAAWDTLGRVCLSVAEHAADPDKPFAFVATYTLRLSLGAKPQHALLGRVLKDLVAKGQDAGVAKIGAALQAAAAHSSMLRDMIADKRLFAPQALTSSEAYRLLCDAGKLEAAGLTLRVPAWWNNGKPPRPQVAVEVGTNPPAKVGIGALLDFRLSLSLAGQPVSPEEWERLRQASAGLVLIRGQWVEVDGKRLEQVLGSWERIAALVEQQGLTFAQALRLINRMQSGGTAAATSPQDAGSADLDWASVQAGAWLSASLEKLRHPSTTALAELGPSHLKATLRPYQKAGVHWLWTLHQLGLGGCLADDMGLGKTIQVLALMAMIAKERIEHADSPTDQPEHTHDTKHTDPRRPHLIIAPATLIGNWQAEAHRFTPQLSVFVAHPSVASRADLQNAVGLIAKADIVIATYGALSRYDWLQTTSWDLVVLDEAQAIKNPQTQQTRAVKSLTSRHRLALTGTPVENQPQDLWSLFDFINPGLLGTSAEFAAHLANSAQREHPYARVRSLIQPYLLRRLKSDRSIIADLPSKTEIAVRCSLTKMQAALYARLVDELKAELHTKSRPEQSAAAGAIQRKGAVLTALMKLKQICNHPAMISGDGDFAAASSGKFQRLLDLAGEIADRQEKVLVFTQFRQMTEVLAQQLTRLFGRPGCVLHGDTPIAERRRLVEDFQREDGPSFFVLSVKAGGTGLTLTQASHVIHFDRWWNPAVEDQATDRAYWIGQTRPVMVHKFSCAGTIEARIADLLASKRGVADELLSGGAELNLTELNDEDLMRLVALDLKQALLAD